MGALDTEGKQYLSNNKIFADAFNYLMYDGDKVIRNTNHRKIDRDTAFFLNRAVNLGLEYEEKEGGIDMCLAMEKLVQREKISGAIEGMRMMGASENDIISKIMESFHVTREYVIELLTPQKV